MNGSCIKYYFLTVFSLLIIFFLFPIKTFARTGVPLVTVGCEWGEVNSAIGCIPVDDTKEFAVFILKWLMGIGGGVALVLIVYSGFLVMTSSGDPKRAQAGKELLTAAVSGLIMLVGATFILRFIGVDLLGILD